MTDKQDALQDIVSIAKRHQITLADITAALTDKAEMRKAESGSILSRLMAYIGGILVFAGVCIFIGMQWDDMGSAARVVITLGSGFCLFVMGIVTLSDARYERATTPLFLAAALLQPFGIFVMLDEYSSGGNPKHGVLFMAGFMILQQGAALLAKQRTVLAFSTLLFSSIFVVTLLDLFGIDENWIGLLAGVSLLCVSWALSQSRHAAISAFWYFVSSIVLFISVFEIVEGTLGEVLFPGLAAFLIYLSTAARSRSLLLVSTLALLGYIGYFTAEHFTNTLGWPVALIFLGLVFIGIGAVAVRINNKYIAGKA